MKNKFDIIYGKNINLRDIEIDDARFILNLRTNDIKNKFLNTTENNLEKQIDYIKKYKKKDNEWYFIIENKNSEKLGTVRIYDIQGNSFCWGSWIIKDESPVGTAIESALLIYEYAFYELKFENSHFDVRKDNLRVRAFHERFGAIKVKETEEDIFYKYDKDKYEFIRVKYLKKYL